MTPKTSKGELLRGILTLRQGGMNRGGEGDRRVVIKLYTGSISFLSPSNSYTLTPCCISNTLHPAAFTHSSTSDSLTSGGGAYDRDRWLLSALPLVTLSSLCNREIWVICSNNDETHRSASLYFSHANTIDFSFAVLLLSKWTVWWLPHAVSYIHKYYCYHYHI